MKTANLQTGLIFKAGRTIQKNKQNKQDKTNKQKHNY